MSGAKYKAWTLLDMAAIPEGPRERFLSELPAILNHMAEMIALQATVGKMSDGALEMKLAEVTWADDDAGEIRTTIDMPQRSGFEPVIGIKKIERPA